MTRPECADSRPLARLVAGLTLALVLAWSIIPAWGKPTPKPRNPAKPARPEAPRPLKPREGAADLRAAMSTLMGQYALEAWSMSESVVTKRPNEAKAARSALETNAGDLAHVLGQVYGGSSVSAFATEWKKHLALLEEYAAATARKDAARQEQVAKALEAQMAGVGRALSGLTGGRLAVDATTNALRSSAALYRRITDGRAAGDYNSEFTALAKSYLELLDLGRDIAGAAAAQFPSRLAGNPTSPQAAFRARFASLLCESAYMQGMAALASLNGRTDEFYAITVRLDLNSEELVKTLTPIVGEDATNNFMSALKKQQGYLADYAHNRDLRDREAVKKLMPDLKKSAQEMTAVVVTMSRRRLLPKNVQKVCDRRLHAQTLIIDSWMSKAWGGGFGQQRSAWAASLELANTLSDAIVEEYAERFNPQPPPPETP